MLLADMKKTPGQGFQRKYQEFILKYVNYNCLNCMWVILCPRH